MDRATLASGKAQLRKRKSTIRRCKRLPLVEHFEPRFLLSTYTVNTTGDPAGAIPGVLSLRQAVAAANAHAGADTINFSSTVFAAPGPHLIALLHGKSPSLTRRAPPL